MLLQEIHHRVKNNLAVVSGLLKIQRFNSDNEELNTILTQSEMRIKSIALIHEKLYQADSFSNIEFGRYIDDLVSNLQETMMLNKEIAISVNCDELYLNVNQAVPCGLILNELVSNALEHAFPGQQHGNIDINITADNRNQITIEVSDNGVGISEVNISDMKHSMGFTIIRTLVKQLQAALDIQNGNGTTVGFTFEKQQIKGSTSGLIGQPI